MTDKRCVNCGIRLGEGIGVECNTLKHISVDLVTKLESWLTPVASQPANRICEPCLAILKSPLTKRFVNRLICVGCGVPVTLDTSVVVKDDELEICRSWVPCCIILKHLTRVCQACLDRVTIYSSKTESEFIAVDLHAVDDELSESSVEIKSEPEYVQSDDENDPIESNCINEDKSSNGRSNQNDFEDVICNQSKSEDEYIISNNDNENDECTNYEYIQSDVSDLSDEDTANHISGVKEQSNVVKSYFYKEQLESDEEYIPKGYKNVTLRKDSEERDKNGSLKRKDPVDTVRLSKYRRTHRIGCCIFEGCEDDCISLIPRVVRRRMIMEFDVYIPRLSRVCEQHLQDQNWEELEENTIDKFTAHHCQDLKDIVREACMTNFDFENIETVDAKLVRYWFDVNKTEFNRIFQYFPQLKRLKEPKTAFSLYLMHLQKTSLDRIALLLKMDKKFVKRKIQIAKDLVGFKSYEELKSRFLDDDD